MRSRRTTRLRLLQELSHPKLHSPGKRYLRCAPASSLRPPLLALSTVCIVLALTRKIFHAQNLDITARTPLKELDPNRELARTSPSREKTMPFSVTADSQGPITGKEVASTAEAKTSPPITIQTPELQEDTRPAGEPSTPDDQSSQAVSSSSPGK